MTNRSWRVPYRAARRQGEDSYGDLRFVTLPAWRKI